MDRPTAPVRTPVRKRGSRACGQAGPPLPAIAAASAAPVASPARPAHALREAVRAGLRGAGSTDFNDKRPPGGTPRTAYRHLDERQPVITSMTRSVLVANPDDNDPDMDEALRRVRSGGGR
ncbi:hypothetical protein GCM10010246_16320 [Streptomyces cuspidosporus]|uniref:Uncharacterized protein n=1 Tax=Streptomyces cuspidosporus TaxID=66882 RepID=A0ABN3FMJ4_9ACTN